MQSRIRQHTSEIRNARQPRMQGLCLGFDVLRIISESIAGEVVGSETF